MDNIETLIQIDDNTGQLYLRDNPHVASRMHPTDQEMDIDMDIFQVNVDACDYNMRK